MPPYKSIVLVGDLSFAKSFSRIASFLAATVKWNEWSKEETSRLEPVRIYRSKFTDLSEIRVEEQ